MNGYSKFEIRVRDLISDLIKSGDLKTAYDVSRNFISRNKSRSLKRKHLLKNTVRHWIDTVNRLNITTKEAQ